MPNQVADFLACFGVPHDDVNGFVFDMHSTQGREDGVTIGRKSRMPERHWGSKAADFLACLYIMHYRRMIKRSAQGHAPVGRESHAIHELGMAGEAPHDLTAPQIPDTYRFVE